MWRNIDRRGYAEGSVGLSVGLLVVMVLMSTSTSKVLGCYVNKTWIYAGKNQIEADNHIYDGMWLYVCKGTNVYFRGDCDDVGGGGTELVWNWDPDGYGGSGYVTNYTNISVRTNTLPAPGYRTYDVGDLYLADLEVGVLEGGSTAGNSCAVKVVEPESVVLKNKNHEGWSCVDQDNGPAPPPTCLYVGAATDGKADVTFWVEDPVSPTYNWKIKKDGITIATSTLTSANNYRHTKTDLQPGDYTLEVTKTGYVREILFRVFNVIVTYGYENVVVYTGDCSGSEPPFNFTATPSYDGGWPWAYYWSWTGSGNGKIAFVSRRDGSGVTIRGSDHSWPSDKDVTLKVRYFLYGTRTDAVWKLTVAAPTTTGSYMGTLHYGESPPDHTWRYYYHTIVDQFGDCIGVTGMPCEEVLTNFTGPQPVIEIEDTAEHNERDGPGWPGGAGAVASRNKLSIPMMAAPASCDQEINVGGWSTDPDYHIHFNIGVGNWIWKVPF